MTITKQQMDAWESETDHWKRLHYEKHAENFILRAEVERLTEQRDAARSSFDRLDELFIKTVIERDAAQSQIQLAHKTLTDEFVYKVVRSKQPHLDDKCKGWRDAFEECKYWLRAAQASPAPHRGTEHEQAT